MDSNSQNSIDSMLARVFGESTHLEVAEAEKTDLK